MSKPSHIFIVGLSRTGTTLTRTILNSSEYVGLGVESMFFGDTRRLGRVQRDGFRHRFARRGDLKTDDGVERIVAHIYEMRKNNFWSNLAGIVERDEFTRQLLATDRSERALLDLAMSYFAGNKAIRGEKTPAHLFSIPTLMEWFPDAKIIHAFRDPRAVYVSNRRKYENRPLPRASVLARQTKLLFEFYASLDVMLNWQRAIQLHQEYQHRYAGQYILSKFEDLILKPRASLQRLCDFIEIPFQDCMLQQLVLNSSFLPKRARAGFDTSAIDRWRQHLHPLINRWFILWCKPRLLEYGYSL